MTKRSSEQPTHRKRILLAVTGLSPQIITETIYALAVSRDPPWLPDEVHLLTTTEGRQRARLALLGKDPGWFRRLLRDHHLPGIGFDESNIHVLPDATGAPLDDIRTEADNERAADFITEFVRNVTNEDTELHVSIAGGRKTMGYYLGYALSLFGRPQDRLSHVLVSEPFESSWEFFYPTPYRRVITTRDNKLANTADATVTLAEIPFLSVRDGLPPTLLAGNTTFSKVVDAARRALAPPHLVVDLRGRMISAGGQVIVMTPRDLAFYAAFARRRTAGANPVRRKDNQLREPFLSDYRTIVGKMSQQVDDVEQSLTPEMPVEYFDQCKSRVNATLKKALGPQLAAAYLIHTEGKRNTGFALRLGAEAIRFGRIDALPEKC